MKLMIVESPNKVKKISSILGDDWIVKASAGHFRDLPKRELGIDETTFELDYEFTPPVKVNGNTYAGGQERINRIKKEIRQANVSMIYLATDPDREGEAIAWHLKEALALTEHEYLRVTFDEITESAIQKAIHQARKIDYALVHAQEARRALDRFVGYKVSPLISRQIGQSLSAGRVQSVAVRVVTDRERAIKSFVKTLHFGALIQFDSWSAEWVTTPYLAENNEYILDKSLAEKAAAYREFRVADCTSKEAKRSPPSPFSTSLLLQAASITLKFDPAVTTKLAQKLFEQGLITYIRTDSVNFSDEAIQEIREFASQKKLPVPDKIKKFKVKGDAQEAHEAIRPTHIDVIEAGESVQEKQLYQLIWLRSLSSQLDDAIYKVNTIELCSTDNKFTYKATGRTLIKKGWRIALDKDVSEEEEQPDENGQVPQLEINSLITAQSGKVLNKETQPPKRFTQASLIKKLENEGVGRPSTYSSIMTQIMSKSYLEETKRYLYPTNTAYSIVDTLIESQFKFIELNYTRTVEKELDLIAENKTTYFDVIQAMYSSLSEEIAELNKKVPTAKFPCPKCSGGLLQYNTKRGLFWGCPDCKDYYDDENGKPIPRKDYPCFNCGTTLIRFQQDKKLGFGWVCPAENCKSFFANKDNKPYVLPPYSCPTCNNQLIRYPRKDKTGYIWICPTEDCDTYLSDKDCAPVQDTVYPCPACQKPLRKVKGKYGLFWSCTGYKEGCTTIMDNQNGKPVPKGQKKTIKKINFKQ